eukprot:TRINITY_DN669_c0_g3_i1.p1 TRINITY_DN669_c0_g3~~TRINITY_DN669_c0_g3_i1.p1  ORF type:complete len:1112 (+),score=108.14 TRINITY_DN669_c0_g3_i1:55-3390(+)
MADVPIDAAVSVVIRKPAPDRPFGISLAALLGLMCVLTTGGAVAAGVLMYYQALEALEETVDEVSREATNAAARSINVSFIEARETTAATRLLFHIWEGAGELSLERFVDFFRNYGFAACVSSTNLYGIGFRMPQRDQEGLRMEENPDYARASVWWDPLRDGSREWTVGLHFPGIEGGSHYGDRNGVRAFTGDDHLVMAYTLDPHTGTPGKFVYNYSDNVAGLRGIVDRNISEEWSGPSYWTSTDGVAYMYMTYRLLGTPPALTNFPAHHLVLVGFLVTTPWQSVLAEQRSLSPDAHLVIADIGLKPRGRIILAHTLYNAPLLRLGCNAETCVNCAANGKHQCQVDIEYLGPTIVKAANVLAAAADFQFIKEDLPGTDITFNLSGLPGMAGAAPVRTLLDAEDYFLRKRRIFTFGDELACTATEDPAACADDWTGFDLLWLRPVSSVEGKVSTALVQTILFVCVNFIVGLVVLVVQLVLVQIPLRRVVKGLERVQVMDIRGAQENLSRVCSRITEVGRLAVGFQNTLDALIEYRSFLPSGILDVDRGCVAAPTDFATMVFTDIQSSTMLWDMVPEAMDHALDHHNEVIRANALAYGGYEVKTIGDAFMLAFSDTAQAVSFCLATQVHLVNLPIPAEFETIDATAPEVDADGRRFWGGLRVRMGVHCGSVIHEENPVTQRTDYRGPSVNKAARCESSGSGGFVSVSKEVHDDIAPRTREVFGGDFVVIDGGLKTMKGIPEPQQLYLLLPSVLTSRQKPSVASANPLRRSRQLSRMTLGLDALPDRARSERRLTDASRSTNPERGAQDSKRAELQLSLTRREASFCCTQAQAGFQDPDILNEAVTSWRYNQIISAVSELSRRFNGSLQSVVGANVFSSWNLGRPCDVHVLQALRFTRMAKEKLAQAANFGVASGPVLFGNAGSQTRRFPVAAGLVPNVLQVLAAHAGFISADALFVHTLPPSRLKPAYSFALRAVDIWIVPDTTTGITVFHVLHHNLVQVPDVHSWEPDAADSSHDTCEAQLRDAFASPSETAFDALKSIAEDDADDVLLESIQAIELRRARTPGQDLRVPIAGIPIDRPRKALFSLRGRQGDDFCSLGSSGKPSQPSPTSNG